MKKQYDENEHAIGENGKLEFDGGCSQCLYDLNAKVPQANPVSKHKSHEKEPSK